MGNVRGRYEVNSTNPELATSKRLDSSSNRYQQGKGPAKLLIHNRRFLRATSGGCLDRVPETSFTRTTTITFWPEPHFRR